MPQEDGTVRYVAKSLILLLCLITLATPALAANYLVIVEVAPSADVKDIASAYEGKVLDALTTNTYLMSIKRLTPRYPVAGVVSIESDVVVRPSRAKGGVVAVKPSTRPDWYFSQPALKLVGTDQAAL